MTADASAFFPSLAPYVARGALHAALAQDALKAFTDSMPAHDFAVDMAAGTLSFVPYDGAPAVFRAHLVASLAPGPRSALWGWAHPRGDEVSALLQSAGLNNRELMAPELPFPPNFPAAEWYGSEEAFLAAESQALAALAHEVATAAVGITGRAPYYSANLGRSRAVFLLDTPFQVSVADLVTKVARMLGSGAIPDHGAGLEGLAAAGGWFCEKTATGMRVADGTATASFGFDHMGRITRITGG